MSGKKTCPSGGEFWDGNEVAFLKAHWGTLGAAAIGIALGRTGNSVIGKADRLGLAKLKEPARGRAGPREPVYAPAKPGEAA
jgi:hypothetical protein